MPAIPSFLRGKLPSSSTSSTFQVLSDLHLEVGQQYASFHIPVAAPNLILAGDIGRLCDYNALLGFLQRQVGTFERVFLALGNHEFYNMSYEQGIHEAARLEREPSLRGKLILLHRRRYDIPDSNTTVLGCTLWSRIPESARSIVRMKVKDFTKIQDWSVDKHNTVFERELLWLQSEVASIRRSSPSRKIIVITHHAPSTRESARPEHVGNPWSSAFATDILDRGSVSGVNVWVFGHTHFTTEFRKRSTKVVSNQRGYVLPGNAPQHRSNSKDTFDVMCTVRL